MSADGPRPEARPRILVVGDYIPDDWQSMIRFEDLVVRGLSERGWSVSATRAEARFGRLVRRKAPGGLGKWLGYLDKFLLFPRALARRVDRERALGPTVVHVIDHSTAPCIPRTSSVPWVATCHDLLAVRGALGEIVETRSSLPGRLLQRWVRTGLYRADAIACDSDYTMADVERLIPHPARAQERLRIFPCLNHPYRPVPREEALQRVGRAASIPWGRPFLTHVGNNHTLKNRAGILRVMGHLRERWSGHLVLCGTDLSDELRALAASLGVADRVHVMVRPSNAELEAVYSLAHAMIFPSTFEGFGWPVIEAQSCDCPAICSNRASLPEAAGEAGLVHSLNDEAGMASSVLQLCEPGYREEIVRRGRLNLRRFDKEPFFEAYGGLYIRAAGRVLLAHT